MDKNHLFLIKVLGVVIVIGLGIFLMGKMDLSSEPTGMPVSITGECFYGYFANGKGYVLTQEACNFVRYASGCAPDTFNFKYMSRGTLVLVKNTCKQTPIEEEKSSRYDKDRYGGRPLVGAPQEGDKTPYGVFECVFYRPNGDVEIIPFAYSIWGAMDGIEDISINQVEQAFRAWLGTQGRPVTGLEVCYWADPDIQYMCNGMLLSYNDYLNFIVRTMSNFIIALENPFYADGGFSNGGWGIDRERLEEWCRNHNCNPDDIMRMAQYFRDMFSNAINAPDNSLQRLFRELSGQGGMFSPSGWWSLDIRDLDNLRWQLLRMAGYKYAAGFCTPFWPDQQQGFEGGGGLGDFLLNLFFPRLGI